MMVSLMQTKEQERAGAAWKCLDEAKTQSDDFKKRYGTLARNLPALIQTNGLGQALAFIYSKAKLAQRRRSDVDRANEAIFNDLSDWVKDELKVSEEDDLLRVLTRKRSSFYRRATAEAMAFAVWLGRFAEAELPREEG